MTHFCFCFYVCDSYTDKEALSSDLVAAGLAGGEVVEVGDEVEEVAVAKGQLPQPKILMLSWTLTRPRLVGD